VKNIHDIGGITSDDLHFFNQIPQERHIRREITNDNVFAPLYKFSYQMGLDKSATIAH
jgi:hypothetical protein